MRYAITIEDNEKPVHLAPTFDEALDWIADADPAVYRVWGRMVGAPYDLDAYGKIRDLDVLAKVVDTTRRVVGKSKPKTSHNTRRVKRNCATLRNRRIRRERQYSSPMRDRRVR